ncbi:26S proteasome regulatory complex, subunit RPN3/PSMD3 [Phaffia rhodozyma]|uniref:26S proteasome regulatory complex, subunit RPN3/PSMD3 n=1 Tax=Phaffia rhodozyma TaxID=264483 RepID=A0A0F7SJM0_PHARH|nr:26S proteasome regulatory complex, subunit RPN3/PSMD3 [Phaffia rhodozyma]
MSDPLAPAKEIVPPAKDETKGSTPSAITPAEPKPKAPLTIKQELETNLDLLDRGVSSFEPRYLARVLRTLTTLRKKLGGPKGDGLKALKEVLVESYPKSSSTASSLASILPEAPASEESMDIDASSAPAEPASSSSATVAASSKEKEVTEILPEADVYLRLLVTLVLIDTKALDKAEKVAHETVDLIQSLNRRSLDHLSAKVYFYLGRIYELQSKEAELRPLFLQAHRNATLRRDEDLQSTLINLLLRNYFAHNLLDQADKLVSKSVFPESAGNAQLARYLYYLGRIKAVQLNYTEAHAHLQQAIRRAPSAHIAPGFLQTAYKFFIVVDLLMGNIPERSTFRLPVLKTALVPYFQIVQAVRSGDLSAFQTALSTHSATFQQDSTSTLILRLRHNVLKTALHQISLAYARISLREICVKLQLDNEQDAEYVVTKAVRDGVLGAGVGVDHEKGWMVCGKTEGVLESGEPRGVFAKRIQFCLDLHNESVKAMRFPLNAHRKDLDQGAEARAHARELAQEIAEGADVDEDDEMDF